MQLFKLASALAVALAICGSATGAPRNLIIFVADGLRAHSVTPESAPALAAVRDEGAAASLDVQRGLSSK